MCVRVCVWVVFVACQLCYALLSIFLFIIFLFFFGAYANFRDCSGSNCLIVVVAQLLERNCAVCCLCLKIPTKTGF